MAFAIMNIRKGKGNGGALENHIDRTEGKEHMYKNANPFKKNLNISLKTAFDGTISERVKECISKNYKGTRAIRNDAVRYISLVLTGSHEQMIKIKSSPKAWTHWQNQNIAFLKEEFGTKNIVKADIHLDEKTPHMHVIIVPITQDGRLSAKEVMGNKKNLKEMLTRYAKKMELLKLERGKENSWEKIRYSKIEEFYKVVDGYKEVKNIKLENIQKVDPRDKTLLLKKVLKGEKIAHELTNLNIKKRGRKM